MNRGSMFDSHVRAGQNSLVAGQISLAIASLFFFPVAAGAQSPDPMPAYASASRLRADASLHAVAFNTMGTGVETPGTDAIGIACGDRGTILLSGDGGETWQLQQSGVDCPLDDVTWIDRQRVVIVGGAYDRITRLSRGVVLYSNDTGKTWQRAEDEELPRLKKVRLREDKSLEAYGDLSHSLLTRELESHDGGRTWHGTNRVEPTSAKFRRPTSPELHQWVHATGIPVAIRDACRVHENTLCAVGDHGVVLLSRDRGKSWQEVRGEDRRTAVLMVSRDASSVAWSLLGSETLEARNRVALMVQDASDEDAPVMDYVHQAAVMLGGSGADAIMNHDPIEQQPDGWIREAMRWMAIHRPAVLVLDRTLSRDVHEAFFQAAATSGVARVVDYSFGHGGSAMRHRYALLPRSGILASDLAADALHYVAPRQPQSPSISLNHIYDVTPTARRGDSLCGGLALGEGRRLVAQRPQVSRRQTQIVQGRLNQSVRIAELVATSRSKNEFSQLLEKTLDQTAKQDQFRLAWSIFLETSRLDGGAAGFRELALEQIASRFASHSAGRWARLRLDSFSHGSELDRLRSYESNSSAPDEAPANKTVPVSPFQVASSGVRQASAVSPLVVPIPETHQLQRKTKPQVEVDLAWEFHPLVLISREAARRRGDEGRLQLTDGESADLRRLTDAQQNAWSGLLADAGPQTVAARRTDSPPKLDGVLNDPCWHSALRSAGRVAQPRIAYDDDYVYVAIECAADKLGPDTFDPTRSSVTRDHDLSSVDRVQLRFDTDRDLMTSMQLLISSAGRTHDSVGSRAAWQPTWYVDLGRAGDLVTIELAILRRDLIELPIPSGESWFFSVKTIRGGDPTTEPIIPDPDDWMRVVFRP